MPTVTFLGGPLDGRYYDLPKLHDHFMVPQSPSLTRIDEAPLEEAVPLRDVVYDLVKRNDGAWFYIEREMLDQAKKQRIDLLAHTTAP